MDVRVDSGRKQRVIIVSLMKSGTHLLQELMVALGYRMYGAGVRLRPEIVPVLDRETRGRIARIAYGKEVAATLEGADEAHFTEATDRAWEALSWSWHIRFNQPLTTWYTRAMVDTGFVEEVHRRAVASDFADTPANVCWVFNQFDITRLDGHFLREWTETGEPRIIFNYRDPRDMTLSMVNFLCGKTGRGFSNYNDFLVFSDILKAKATFDEQVGPRGGGSAQAQAQALARVSDFLGVSGADAPDVAARLFNPGVFSFYKGQIGGWRTAFTAEHQRLAAARFGD